MLKSKKGISPILATLLLIVIAVAAVIVTYAWVMTFTTTQTQQAGAILSRENVRFYGTNSTAKNRISLTIRNIGTSDAKIVRVYLGTSPANLIEVTADTYRQDDSTPLGTAGVAVTAGGATTVIVHWPLTDIGTTWAAGTTYYFKIAPETGVPFDFFEKAPSS